MIQENGELAYIPSLLVQSPLPVRDPKDGIFVRQSGNQKITLSSSIGIPFGHVGRLTLALAVTDVIRNKSPKVELGTVTSWLSRLNTSATGGVRGTIGAVKEQFNRIGDTKITLSSRKQHTDGVQERRLNFLIAGELELFWDNRVSFSESPTLFENYLQFDNRFFDYLLKHAVPVDLEIYDQFQAPLAQDIYAWAVWKLGSLEAPLPLRWEAIEAQFSDSPIGVKHKSQWRKRWLLAAVEVISAGYNGAKVEGTETGILLHPSPKAIKPREKGFLF